MIFQHVFVTAAIRYDLGFFYFPSCNLWLSVANIKRTLFIRFVFFSLKNWNEIRSTDVRQYRNTSTVNLNQNQCNFANNWQHSCQRTSSFFCFDAHRWCDNNCSAPPCIGSLMFCGFRFEQLTFPGHRKQMEWFYSLNSDSVFKCMHGLVFSGTRFGM